MSDFGELKDYIIGAATKRLTAVECRPDRSNGHEINATRMKVFMGTDAQSDIPTIFIRLDDDYEKITHSVATTSWWFRDRTAQGRGVEYRLYYQDNPAISHASIGDSLAVVKKIDGSLIFVTAPENSQSELELYEVFGDKFSEQINTLDFSQSHEELSVTKRYILEQLGFEIKPDFGQDYLELIAERFGGLIFPATKDFSQLARETAGHLNEYDLTDDAIISWWDTEEAMFRQLEGVLIESKLDEGFSDAEDFLAFSQTIRQRRNARAGNALENHLAFLFSEKGIDYDWEPKTENNKKPDFLFPSISAYQDGAFSAENLTMLGVKTTCKDRWRQVLSEADRIENKHLFTLQPRISENQTQEMIESKLQLVVPRSIHTTYTQQQREWLWDLEQFVQHVSVFGTKESNKLL